jgi:hypothetical protein
VHAVLEKVRASKKAPPSIWGADTAICKVLQTAPSAERLIAGLFSQFGFEEGAVYTTDVPVVDERVPPPEATRQRYEASGTAPTTVSVCVAPTSICCVSYPIRSPALQAPQAEDAKSSNTDIHAKIDRQRFIPVIPISAIVSSRKFCGTGLRKPFCAAGKCDGFEGS